MLQSLCIMDFLLTQSWPPSQARVKKRKYRQTTHSGLKLSVSVDNFAGVGLPQLQQSALTGVSVRRTQPPPRQPSARI